MNCAQCNAVLVPGDLFCGECGAAVPQIPTVKMAPFAVTETDLELTTVAPTASPGKYSAEISRQNPGCLVFLVDQSGSMEEPIGGGTGEKKKQVVADAINRLLYNLVLRCAKEDGVRPYFDVGVWSYGGAAEVRRTFDADLVSISKIAEQPKRTEVRKRRVPDGAGGVFEEDFELPVWFDPVAHGRTPMHAAYRAALAPVRDWLNRHPDSFPPIVINLSDGAYTDESPAPLVQALMQLSTSDGQLLVFNCHLSKLPGMAITFPNDEKAAGMQGLARVLYDFSSPLPAPMCRQAQAKGYTIGAGARGYVFNADLVALIDFLDVGTRALQDRMESD